MRFLLIITGLVVGYLLGSRLKFGAMLIFDYEFSTIPLMLRVLPYLTGIILAVLLPVLFGKKENFQLLLRAFKKWLDRR